MHGITSSANALAAPATAGGPVDHDGLPRLDLCDRGTPLWRPADAARIDPRFRDLVPRAAWQSLPEAVRCRFSDPLEPGAAKVYTGVVTQTQLTALGRLLANAARLVGAPLPLDNGGHGLALTTMMEAPASGGQVWTRHYARRGPLPQIIRSVKRFSGPTGLEEYLGYGLLMRLVLSVEARALVFRSDGYAIEIGGRAFAFPRWLSPGVCTIEHRDLGGGEFTFALTLDHPWLGRLVQQTARFRDPMPQRSTNRFVSRDKLPLS